LVAVKKFIFVVAADQGAVLMEQDGHTAQGRVFDPGCLLDVD
jgi:hypothetical protein